MNSLRSRLKNTSSNNARTRYGAYFIPKMPKEEKSSIDLTFWCIITSFIFLILILTKVTFNFLFPQSLLAMDGMASSTFLAFERQEHYIFIDAGSGGTRAHLLHAKKQGNNSLQIAKIDSVKSDALSDEIYVQADLVRAINELKMKHSLMFVKGIWLRATAGLRLLPPEKRDTYISDVEYLLKSSFPREFESAEIMSGEEEALFEWIQQNSEDGIFTHKKTRGAICVGGASVQVIFDMKPFPRPNIIAFKKTPILDARMFYMYTHSWLGYGQEEVMDSFMHEQAKKQRFNCGCLPKNYVSMNRTKYVWPGMNGDSNFGECLYAIEDFVAILDAKCKSPTFYDPCVFGDYMQPHAGIKFRATGKLGKLAYTASEILQLDSVEDVRPGHLFQAAKVVCEKDQTTSGKIPECFSLIFYRAFLNRLGFSDWDDSITFVHASQGWVEGALRYQLSNYDIKRDF